jgi:ferredoxin-NADP reductase
VTQRVAHLTFERVGGLDFRFTPGQWVSLTLPIFDAAQKPLRRSYSIASAPLQNRFELLVTKVDQGPGSTWLHEAQLGTTFEVKGAQGTFAFAADSPSLIVATGTGYAPIRSMLHAVTQLLHPVSMLLGFRSQADALFPHELKELTERHPQLELYLTLSQPDRQWRGLTGRVQQHAESCFEKLQTRSHLPPQVLICGVNEMLLSVRTQLKNRFGLDRKRIRAEGYG